MYIQLTIVQCTLMLLKLLKIQIDDLIKMKKIYIN
jgi:hypothetical protein